MPISFPFPVPCTFRAVHARRPLARFAALALASLALAGVPLAAEPSPWTAGLAAELPPGATLKPLLDVSGEAWICGERDGITRRIVPAGNQPAFAEATRVDVPRAFEKPWGAAAHSPLIPVAVPAGRVLLVTMWMRSEVTQGGQSATVKAYMERTPEWDGLGETGGTLDANWRRIHIACVTPKAYAANSLRLAVHLGFGKQIVDLGPISIIDAGPADRVDVRAMPTNRIQWPGMEADAPWRAEAARRIDTLRRRDLALTVLAADGAPLAGAPVALKQLRRTFSFGSFTGHHLLQAGADGERLRERFDTLFDRVTLPIYWADWGWLQNEDKYVELARWASDRRPPPHIRGHTLIYPGWQFMPTHMKALARDPAAFQAACLAQIRWVAERLRGVPFTEIDVTNELRTLDEVVAIVGREGVVEWFAEARRAFPGVKLCLNENTILTNGGQTRAEQDNLLEWYRFLKSRGQAPEVLGFQGHFSEGVTGAETIWKILDRFAAETDAEIQITEYDLNTLNDQAHADYTRDLLTALFAHERVTSVTLWGFWEGDHWIPNAAIWRKDWSPRPAAAVYEELLGRSWRTALSADTDSAGALAGRVFHGELEAAVTLPGGRVVRLPFAVPAGEGVARITLRLPAE